VKLGLAFARGIFVHDYPRIPLPAITKQHGDRYSIRRAYIINMKTSILHTINCCN
jgi:hypothetical protein